MFKFMSFVIPVFALLSFARSSSIEDEIYKKHLSEVRQALQPFSTNVERSDAISKYVCGSLVRGSVYGNQRASKKYIKIGQSHRQLIKDENATIIVPAGNKSSSWNDFTFYASIDKISHFPSLAPLSDADRIFVKKYFSGDREGDESDKIEAASSIEMKFYFTDNKLKKIEAICDSND